MNIKVLTLFPEMIENTLSVSMTGRAIEKGLLEIEAVNIRDYAFNKHHSVDDYPYGGGAGMLMQAEPIYQAYAAVSEKMEKKPRVVFLAPHGETFSQDKAIELSKEENLIFLCGHYEGVDERVVEEIVTDVVSIGDYVLTGGELPALVFVDALSRMAKGVLSDDLCFEEESHYNGLLEYPQYTKPQEWRGMEVPAVLTSGHHANVDRWRYEQSLINTAKKRPDMLKNKKLSPEDREFVQNYINS